MRRVVIIGAGAAGVFTAWRLRQRLGDAVEIVLLEKSDRVGGNALTTTVTVDGRPYAIDCGAQFFAAGPQPQYVQLLTDLGLTQPPAAIESHPAGLTLWDGGSNQRRLWIPGQPVGFLRYRAEDWARLIQFAKFLVYASLLDRDKRENWTLSVDDWLPTLTLLSDEFKDEVVRPLLYQFVTLPFDRIGEASARYAITYLVRNASSFEVLQSTIGLDGILQRVLTASDVMPRLNETVLAVSRDAGGTLHVTTSAGTTAADDVVFATDPQSAAAVLNAGAFPAPALVAVLAQCEYDDLRISLQHGAPCWMPADARDWEAVNTVVDGSAFRFSVWFGPLRDRLDGGDRIPVFKSWATPDLDPSSCAATFFSHAHRILMPTTTFMAKREEVRSHQGGHRVWFAGGWTTWFDSQEAALESATAVASAIAAPGARSRPVDIRPGFDHDRQRARLDSWVAGLALHAPPDRRVELQRLVNEVEARG